jgi:hypothetical protein
MIALRDDDQGLLRGPVVGQQEQPPEQQQHQHHGASASVELAALEHGPQLWMDKQSQRRCDSLSVSLVTADSPVEDFLAKTTF